MDSQDDAMDTGVDVVIELVEAVGPIELVESEEASDPIPGLEDCREGRSDS